MDRRYVRLDPRKLDFLRLKKGWTVEKVYDLLADGETLLDKRTVKGVLDGEPKFLNSAKIVAELLGAEDLVSVLHPDLLAEIGAPSGWGTPLEFFSKVGEWDVIEPIGDAEQTSNGLRYDLWRTRHRQIPNRFGRAKCYDLSQLTDRDRARLRSRLTRHAEICDRLGTHPQIARNYDALPWDHAAWWWVIDEWIEGKSLATLLQNEKVAIDRISNLMRQVAAGLEHLHSKEIIRRELSPRFIVVRTADQSAVLTDFELAKLLDGAPTVSPKRTWPDDDYRALEVDSEATIDPRADIYSWGRILVHAVCGHLPPRGSEPAALAKSPLPPEVRKLATSCVALPPSDRPATMAVVLHAIRNWK